MPPSILAASECSVPELLAMKNEIVALRDRLNAVVEGLRRVASEALFSEGAAGVRFEIFLES